MKIALCKSHFFGPVSGADEILVSYATALHRSGQDVEVVLLYKPSDGDRFYQRLRNAGVPVAHIIRRSVAFMILRGIRNLLSSFLLLFLLIPRSEKRLRKIWQLLTDLIYRAHYGNCRAYFAQCNYDVLHVFTPDTGAALIIRAGGEAGIPVLYHEMGTPHHLPGLTQYYRRLENVLPLCSEVAALSPLLATQWSQRFPFLASVSVLPLISEESEMLLLPTALPLKSGSETIFGFAARIEEGKGPFVLFDALPKLRERGANVRVRVAGTGPALHELKARVHQSGLQTVCECVGAYSGGVGRSAFMNTLDVFVLPSYAEGTSKSVIEAMSHGLPIITTTVGGSPDLVTPETGILVEPGDSLSLADAMQRLASDAALRKRMGQAARQRYEELFAPAAVLPMLVDTYSRLTGRNEVTNGHHPWSARSVEKVLAQVMRGTLCVVSAFGLEFLF
jgi:glycosyltransferase involved in cell wall biosynthesis